MYNTFGRKWLAPTNPRNDYTICSLTTYDNGPGTFQNMMLRCTRRNRCSGDCTRPCSIVQPNTVHTGKLPPLQYNPDTKASPTNLLFDRKCLLSPFIALCLTPPVTLLERHHQSWTKQKAKVHQRKRQQKYYCHNNSTDGAKSELVHGFGPCRCTAATVRMA